MALFVVATPIGHAEDISLRALRCLEQADLVIGEERRELLRLLRSLGLEKPVRLLNEHTQHEEIAELAALCQTKTICLVSDCGTPGFCDPGALLVARARELEVAIRPIPGASSLMSLLSVAGVEARQFVFVGFLPARDPERSKALSQLQVERRAIVIMDTPYRLGRTLADLGRHFPQRSITLGADLTLDSEQVVTGLAKKLEKLFAGQKREFILLMHAV